MQGGVWYEDPIYNLNSAAGDTIHYLSPTNYSPQNYVLQNRDSVLVGNRYIPRYNGYIIGNVRLLRHMLPFVSHTQGPYAILNTTLYYKNDTL
jgi:hypothetical protein